MNARGEDSLDPATRAELEALRAECARLRESLAQSQRAERQMHRVAARSEAMAIQSRRAMLRWHDDLQQSVEKMRAAKAEAEQAAHAKGRFLATMSHELRTPLNGMVGSAELLLTTELRPDQVELVELLHRSGNALLAIVNDVLDYSRIEAGRMPVDRQPFKLLDCVRGVVELERQVAREKGIELRTQYAEGLPEVVCGDDGRVRQVLMNLVTNAIKFTAAGSVTVRVEPAGEADMVAFAVVDTGIGIPEAAQRQLFEAFAQADSSTTRRFGGTGLGLAICRRLVHLMGGEIGVRSALGDGTTMRFTCRLPRVAAPAPAAAVEPTPVAVATDGTRGHVLVVDDNAGNRLLARRMLERLGWTCDEAVDGVGAVASVGTSAYDVVLMDCNMPVLDGYDATRAIRGLGGRTAHVPIIALTANAMPEDEARCREAGMDAYLAKPLRKQQLAALLDRYQAPAGDDEPAAARAAAPPSQRDFA